MGQCNLGRIGTILLVAAVTACGESPVGSAPAEVMAPEDGAVEQLIQRGNVLMGYQAPELSALDLADGVRVCAMWADPLLAAAGFDPDHLSFDFEIHEPSTEDGGSHKWNVLGSAQPDSMEADACLDIPSARVLEAHSGLEEGDAWLQVKAMARTGQGRTTLIHHTEDAFLLVGEAGGSSEVGEVSGSVGPEGGELELLDDEGQLLATLIVPAGALSTETTLTLRSEPDPDEPAGGFLVPGTAVFLSPSGTEFDTPVTLTIPFNPGLLPDETETQALQIHRVEEDGTTVAQPSTVDLVGGTVTAELSSFSLYAVYSFPPMVVWVGGAAPDPRDWHNPENWTGYGGAPTEVLSAFVNEGESHYPRISGSMGSVRSLTIEPGASVELDGAGLSVHGSLTVGGVMSAGGGETVVMDGDGLKGLQGNLPNLWVAGGRTSLAGNVQVEGNLMMTGLPEGTPPTLEVGEHVLDVGGDLTLVTGHPVHLLMTESMGRVIVRGNASFGAPSVGETPLRGGTLELHGNFRQIGDANAYSPGGNHWTLFAGGDGIQTVDFEHPGAGSSRFGVFELGATEEVQLLSDVVANNLSFSDEGIGARLTGDAALTAVVGAYLRGPVSLNELRVGGDLGWDGHTYLVARTTFTAEGPPPTQPQSIPSVPYQDVAIEGDDLTLGADFVTIGGNLHLVSGSFHVDPQRLLTVRGDLIREGGRIHMDNEGDRLVVYGTVDFQVPVGEQDLKAGRLWIGGDVKGLYGAAEEHFTILFGSDRQDLFAPGMGSLAITNSGEGVYFHSDELPLRFLDLVGNSRILQELWISVIHVNFRSMSSTFFEPGARFNCTSGWREPGAESNGGCDPPLAEQHGQLDPDRRPELDFYALPSALQLSITSPAAGSDVLEDSLITFSATATLGDEPAPATLTWFSSLDGELGTGSSLGTDKLSRGLHLITVRAELSDGLQAFASIDIKVIQDPNDPVELVASSLTAGRYFSCGLDMGGRAYCWGENAWGQLGDGTTEQRDTPTPVAGDLLFSQISAGYGHTCAVTPDGVGYCWGRAGGLGDGQGVTGDPRYEPHPVEGDLTFSSIIAGGSHSCGVASGGIIYCWGRNSAGQVGIGRRSSGGVPTAIESDLRFTQLDTHDRHTCAIDTEGAAHCWGVKTDGALGHEGDEDDPNYAWIPYPVRGGLIFNSISVGEKHTCAVEASGALFCWGTNDEGQLGNLLEEDADEPTRVAGYLTAASVTSGYTHSCAVTTIGETYCWGLGTAGQLGQGSSLRGSREPLLVVGDHSWARVHGGRRHTCGVTPQGQVLCWGRGQEGQLGDGSAELSHHPVSVVFLDLEEGG